jgi:hypothetical protein
MLTASVTECRKHCRTISTEHYIWRTHRVLGASHNCPGQPSRQTEGMTCRWQRTDGAALRVWGCIHVLMQLLQAEQ